MFENIIALVLSMVVVFIAALLFVNAIEYIGCRLRWGGSFVAATLAPLFTSLPEMIIFLVALFGLGGMSGEEIGVGTLFGQPFMASSLSYGLVGVVAYLGYKMKRRGDTVLEVSKHLVLPYAFITVLFPATLIPALVGGDLVRYLFGFIFLASYIVYAGLMLRSKRAELIEKTEDPYICRLVKRPLFGGALQLIIAVLLLYFASNQMVGSVASIAVGAGVSALGLAIILIPAATAIPETASALIWAWNGKDTLSIGALVGEKVLYATFYPGLGLFLTSWKLDIHAYISVLACFIVSVVLMYFIAKQKIPWYALLIGLVFFVGYAATVFFPMP